MVLSRNHLGDGLFSKPIAASTQGEALCSNKLTLFHSKNINLQKVFSERKNLVPEPVWSKHPCHAIAIYNPNLFEP